MSFLASIFRYPTANSDAHDVYACMYVCYVCDALLLICEHVYKRGLPDIGAADKGHFGMGGRW